MSSIESRTTFKELEKDEEMIGYKNMAGFVSDWLETYCPPQWD